MSAIKSVHIRLDDRTKERKRKFFDSAGELPASNSPPLTSSQSLARWRRSGLEPKGVPNYCRSGQIVDRSDISERRLYIGAYFCFTSAEITSTELAP